MILSVQLHFTNDILFLWKPISNINSEKKFRSLFLVSIFLRSRYFEIVSRYYEIVYLFPVSKFLLSHYYEITSLFPVSIFLLSRYFEIGISLRGIRNAEMSARHGKQTCYLKITR